MVKAVPKKLTRHTSAVFSHCCQPLCLSTSTHSTSTSGSPTVCTLIPGQVFSISSTRRRTPITHLFPSFFPKWCTFSALSFALILASAHRRLPRSDRNTSSLCTSTFLSHLMYTFIFGMVFPFFPVFLPCQNQESCLPHDISSCRNSEIPMAALCCPVKLRPEIKQGSA